ncbi:DUF2934 domain-containing protein [Chelativorans salis]|uniref:DUF2934 domain-containing protein n=1 Tax=Chelativorans salis TaxID=2978478 RepID=A0ABT2LK68_9HYPH|nr:DUF2934 domain-containing protein [Chelativorans sp. EGI FJ00035]MCT7374217.1 DUF2934 domain-containing protein [Chelativorans sp. EGI FJ00035]
MPSDREERIRRRAYELWEIEGRPEGQHHEHWERAAREIEAEEGGNAENAEIPEMPEDFPETSGSSGPSSKPQPGSTKRGARSASIKSNTGKGADNTKRRGTGTAKQPKRSP